MKTEDYITAVERESRDLAGAAEGHLDAEVVSCPGWSVRDLVVHTGEVHRFWTEVVDKRLQTTKEVNDLDYEETPGNDDPVAWFTLGSKRLAQVLREAEPETAVWSWSRQKDVAFVHRRMAQETAVHRWDAQKAARAPRPIEPSLAADGIDEFFFIHLPVEDAPLEGSGETIHFHQSDGDGEWLAHLTPSGVEVSSGHAKGEAAARGTASDLLLLLWRRLPGSDIETFGNRELLERFLGWMDLG